MIILNNFHYSWESFKNYLDNIFIINNGNVDLHLLSKDITRMNRFNINEIVVIKERFYQIVEFNIFKSQHSDIINYYVNVKLVYDKNGKSLKGKKLWRFELYRLQNAEDYIKSKIQKNNLINQQLENISLLL